VAGEDIVHQGVTVVGLTNPPASMPTHASFLYSRNIANFLGLVVTDGELAPDFGDEIVAGTCVVRAGTVVHAPTRDALGLPPAPTSEAVAEAPTADPPAAEPPSADPSAAEPPSADPSAAEPPSADAETES